MGPFMSIAADSMTYFHHASELAEQVMRDQRQNFERICVRLSASPTDHVAAWDYLTNHPIFWRYGHVELGEALDEAEIRAFETHRNLIADDGLRDMWMKLHRDADGAAVVVLEHGPHMWASEIDPKTWGVRPLAGMGTHDPDLDSAAPTFELAIVALAARVRAKYGDSRPAV